MFDSLAELSGSGLQSKLPVGAVVGGVVGGMAVTIFAAYVIFLIFRKKTPNKYPQFGRKYEGMCLLGCGLGSGFSEGFLFCNPDLALKLGSESKPQTSIPISEGNMQVCAFSGYGF